MDADEVKWWVWFGPNLCAVAKTDAKKINDPNFWAYTLCGWKVYGEHGLIHVSEGTHAAMACDACLAKLKDAKPVYIVTRIIMQDHREDS